MSHGYSVSVLTLKICFSSSPLLWEHFIKLASFYHSSCSLKSMFYLRSFSLGKSRRVFFVCVVIRSIKMHLKIFTLWNFASLEVQLSQPFQENELLILFRLNIDRYCIALNSVTVPHQTHWRTRCWIALNKMKRERWINKYTINIHRCLHFRCRMNGTLKTL